VIGLILGIFIGIFIGFAFGYGVREFISRRRRTLARKRLRAELEAEHERPLSPQEQVDSLRLMVAIGRPLAETKR
jgi:hypothetical protein